MTPRASTPVTPMRGPVGQLVESAALLTDSPEGAVCALIAAAAMILRTTGIDADAAVLLAEVLQDPEGDGRKGGGL